MVKAMRQEIHMPRLARLAAPGVLHHSHDEIADRICGQY